MTTQKTDETNRKTQYTPGPWTVDYSGPARLAIMGPRDEYVALCNMQCEDGDIDEANARLIASAPALVEALQTILAVYIDVNEDPARIPELARAALRSAGIDG